MDKYEKFLQSKLKRHIESGFEISEDKLNPMLFDFQKFIVAKCLKRGRSAIFADCGLGKTPMQLEWAHQVSIREKKPVLILTPLAVSLQTINEGKKFHIAVKKYDGSKFPIQICNYEQLDNIDCNMFAGIVLDESSILKNFTGETKKKLIEYFANTKYKLCCTATPSPNDFLELGNHSEFLNIMTSRDMRAIFFTTDKEIIDGNKYRLKKHSYGAFFNWLSHFSIFISTPEDLGFKNEGYKLPELIYKEYIINTPKKENGKLFNDYAVNATNFNAELRETMEARMSKVIEIVNNSNENFIIWIKHNAEGEYLQQRIKNSVNVQGSDPVKFKEDSLIGFAKNKFKCLITKTKIASFGLNYQNCSNEIFASLDFSFEQTYQAIRRVYRYMQKKDVTIHIITTDTMSNVIQTIKKKQNNFNMLNEQMRNAYIKAYQQKEITKRKPEVITETYNLIHGDCVEEIKKIETDSIGYTFFSPPFGALYVFSNDIKDFSNVKDNDELYKHFEFLIPELLRVTKPGRLCSMHVMQSTTLVGRDGYYSIIDFRGDLIRLFQKHGFIFHAENMIRKDPKTAAIRTKNRQLMWGTTKKDSAIVRPGLADYIITFRKPGENLEPITNNIPFNKWCELAEPVWIDINEGNTLKGFDERDEKDERHITVTQLETIKNCLMIWSNENDTIFTPFAGIGSEMYQAIKMNRKAIGIELKESYFDTATKNLEKAMKEIESEKNQYSLI